jgi:acetyl-CoA acetyltransferase
VLVAQGGRRVVVADARIRFLVETPGVSREMGRRGARYGLEAMCIGGGQGLAAVF